MRYSLIPLIVAVSVLPAAAVPTSPATVSATVQNATTVRINWSSVSGATGYRVYRNGSLVTDITSPSTVTYTNTGLSPNTAYEFAVSAYDIEGESQRTEATEVTTPTLPGIPSGLRGSATSSSVTLNWSAVTGATGYVIFRDGTEVGESTTTTYTDTDVESSTTYRYSVAASTSAGESAASTVLSVSTLSQTNLRQAYWTRVFRETDSNFDDIVDFEEYKLSHIRNPNLSDVILYHRFVSTDDDNSGDLTADEYVAHFAGRTIRKPTLAQMFYLADTMNEDAEGSGDGLLSLEEYALVAVRRLKEPAVIKAFDKRDKNGTDRLSEQEFGIRGGDTEDAAQ